MMSGLHWKADVISAATHLQRVGNVVPDAMDGTSGLTQAPGQIDFQLAMMKLMIVRGA